MITFIFKAVTLNFCFCVLTENESKKCEVNLAMKPRLWNNFTIEHFAKIKIYKEVVFQV